MIAAFQDLGANPYLFRLLIDDMIARPDTTPKAAVKKLRRRLHEALGFEEQWLRLNALQRAVAASLADGVERPFSEAAVKSIASMIGDSSLTTGRVQTALKKLAREGLASPATGEWKLEDTEFAAFVREKLSGR
jgi:hypothetical protein